MLCKSCFKVKVKSDEILKSKFDHIFKFCYEYLIFLFVLLLCEGAYSYKYVNGWNKFEKPFLQNIQNFSISLHFAKASEIDWRHPKIIYNTFEIKNLGHYPHLYFQIDTFLCNVFQHFVAMCLKIWYLRSLSFLCCTWIIMESTIEKGPKSSLNYLHTPSRPGKLKLNLLWCVSTGKSKQSSREKLW